MTGMIERWKRYTATRAGIRWQRDFFDHRLRADESFEAKSAYIRQNPVRAGLSAERRGLAVLPGAEVGTSLRDVCGCEIGLCAKTRTPRRCVPTCAGC
jgi:hypothetical protein